MIAGTPIAAGRRVDLPAVDLHAHVWDDMSDAVDDIVNAPEWAGMSSRDEDPGRVDWFGSESFGHAVKMLRDGWDEHRDAVERVIAQVADDPSIEEMMATRFGWTHDFAGLQCDVGRYVVGEPECMIAPMMVEARQPDAVVRIVIVGGAIAAIDPATIEARGVMVAALVDTLAKLGRGVEVWWCAANTPSGARATVRRADVVKVKSTDEPIDLDDLLFVTASPSMLRRFGFALRELETHANRKRWGITDQGGYGRSVDLNREELAEIIGGPVHVTFGAIKPEDDYSDPVAHVLAHLKGLQDVDAG